MRLVLLTLFALTAGCTNFPEFDGAQSPGVSTAPWPRMVPMDGLVRAGTPVRTQPEMGEDLDSRAEALRRRAEALQGSVVDSTARDRMDGGVAFPEVPDA